MNNFRISSDTLFPPSPSTISNLDLILICFLTIVQNSDLVISKEEILYAGTSKDSRKSTADSSKGVLKHLIPTFLAYLNNGSCHSNGVCALL